MRQQKVSSVCLSIVVVFCLKDQENVYISAFRVKKFIHNYQDWDRTS